MSDVQLSLAEELGKAIDEAETTPVADVAPQEAAPQGEDGVKGAEGKDTITAASGDDRPRDEHGRFVKKEEAEEPKTEATQPIETPAQPQAQPQAVDLPPSTWTAAAKAEYAKLPDVIKSELKKREGDYQKGIEQYKQRAEIGERLLSEFRPYEALMRAQGATPEGTIRSLLNTAYLLNTGSPQQKAQLLLQAAQQYGADLSMFTQQPQEGQPDLRGTVQQLMQPYVQQFSQFQNQFLTAQQQRDLAEQQETLGRIEAFRTATDEKGQPKHVYFDNVRGLMASLIESGTATSIDQAYEMACRAHPEVSQALNAEQRKAQEAKQLEEARRNAEAAKRAVAVNVSGAGGVGIADTSKMSIRDELAARLDSRI